MYIIYDENWMLMQATIAGWISTRASQASVALVPWHAMTQLMEHESQVMKHMDETDKIW